MSIRVGDNIIAGGGVPINKSGMSIFDFKWTDHLLSSPSWIRADTFSWQNGITYELAYQHLVEDINGKSLTSETIGTTTIQYYLADDGHKICPETEEANVGQIFLDTGVAWYYILDETNTRFKLPRTEHGVVGVRGNVGDYIEPGLPNITGTIEHVLGDRTGISSANAFSGSASIGTNGNNRSWNDGAIWFPRTKVTFNASNSNSIYGSSTTVQSPATQMYLYFYVGEFTQTAIYNTAGINTELFNNKVSIGHEVIAFQVPTAQNNYTWYRLYADGWVEQGGNIPINVTSINLPIEMAHDDYECIVMPRKSTATNNVIWKELCSNSQTTTGFTVTSFSATSRNWEVKGMAATI